MRIRNLKNKNEILNSCDMIIDKPFANKGKWNNIFDNENPIHLEIGTGKCKFIMEMALKYPNINFIGVERNASVLALGVRDKNYISNLKLIYVDALGLEDVFDHEVNTIYLNFSDPWPKKRHEKRRLTSSTYLNVYNNLFKDKKNIIMKTDNRGLFEYSIVSLSNDNYVIKDISLDLHKLEKDDNINTEYEEKFSNKGFPIYMLKAEK